MAVSIGHLEYISAWKTQHTRIGLTLNGDNFKIALQIVYSDLKYSNLY